jgi:pyruvate kinase
MAKTKIIATIGPACDDLRTIEKLVKAGVNVFRLNFKHSSLRWHALRMKRIQEVTKKLKTPIGLMVDIRGPEGRTEKPETLFADDLKAIALAKKHQADFVALSFVREQRDIKNLKRVLEKENFKPLCIAKIEARSAIENFDGILLEADGIMVARGDLGVELPFEQVPFWQKYIIQRCLRAAKPVITATEMLDSMIEKKQPTRAEVSDVANSVYDRSDTLMLSGETAIGKHPIRAVEVMRKTCEFIEGKLSLKAADFPVHKQTEAMVLAAFNLVGESDLPQRFAAFVVLTEEGKTARILSSLRPNLPIIAVTPDRNIQDRLCLSFGVESAFFDYRQEEVSKAVKSTIEFLQKKGRLKRGEKVVMIYGDDWRFPGRTNLVRIQEV